MQKITAVLLFSSLMAAINANRALTFTCREVATSICNSGFQYRTQGTYENIVLDNTYCVEQGKTCTPGTHNFNIQVCKVDYKNDACSTGVCFMVPQEQICSTDMTCGTEAQPQSFTIDYSCDDCTCGKCFVTDTTSSGNTTTDSQCLGSTCTEGLSSVSSTVKRCTGGKDYLGQACQCCTETAEIARYCTSNSDALKSAGVTTWLKRVSGLFEYKLQTLVVVIFIAIIGLII